MAGLKDKVLQKMQMKCFAHIATDGSAVGRNIEQNAGWAIAVEEEWVKGGEVDGMDQTSYMSEVWALYKTMCSIEGLAGKIDIIIDNQSVQKEAPRCTEGKGRREETWRESGRKSERALPSVRTLPSTGSRVMVRKRTGRRRKATTPCIGGAATMRRKKRPRGSSKRSCRTRNR